MTTSSGRLDDDDDDHDHDHERRRYALIDQDFLEASEQLLFVFPELRASFRSPSSLLESGGSAMVGSGGLDDRHSGVLWKRRDVFKNRWRPRWFALNPGQGILTYYLLNAPNAPSSSSSRTSPATAGTPSYTNGGGGNTLATRTTPSSSSSNDPRLRATSWDSQVSGVSENSVDYDVVPRGTIFLLGCTVYVNDLLSKPSENLYAFTIRPPAQSNHRTGGGGESSVHLAARSIDARQMWVERIAVVCNRRPPVFHPSSSLPTNFQSPNSSLYQQQHSIPEDGVLLNGVDAPSSLPTSTKTTTTTNTNGNTAWSTLGPTDPLYKDLPESLASMIRDKIKTFLPMCQADLDRPPWKVILQTDTIASTTTDPDGTGRSIVQSRKTFRNLPALHIFSLLIDISRRHLYEGNVQADERIKVLNDHTFLDYYSYKAVWPTSSREFAVCTHWQIVQREQQQNDNNAILMVSFSCPESDAIRAVADGQVRGQAIVSMVLLEDIMADNGGRVSCQATRIVSFDLGGSMSLHLTNIVVAQQAGLPTVVEDYLHRNEPDSPECYRLPLTYENAWQHVVARVAKPKVMATTNHNGNGRIDPVGEMFAVNGDGSSSASSHKRSGVAPLSPLCKELLPSLEQQAMVLLAPVLLHKLALICGLPGSSLVFVLSVFCALRQVVLMHLGAHLGHSAMAVNTVTCRFWVDPKGMQRFVANKREEREELRLKKTTEVVLPLHLVVSAVARALQASRQICRQRVQYTMLFIDRVVSTYKGSVDVTVVENDQRLTVRNVTTAQSVTDIAKSLSASLDTSSSYDRRCGQCLVVALDDSENSQLIFDATSENRDIAVIAVIQGLRKIDGGSPSVALRRGRRSSFKIAVSLTIQGHSESLIQDAETFAHELQKMLQFPEICEN